MIRLYADGNGEPIEFDGVVAKYPHLRRWVEERRLEGERRNAEYEQRLHSENMAMVGGAEPTREVTHVVGVETELARRRG